MTLHPAIAQLLMPNRSAVIFAVKGIISMTLALFASMQLGLDRPYWALVSALFLQIRPESGLVIEKALCQIGGSVVGGAVGIVILASLTPYPLLALASLTLWIGFCSACSAMVHNTNFIYAFAMSGMTAGLVVLLVIANPMAASSETVFQIAQSRISEISVGALCAMLVSHLLWPVKVNRALRVNARGVINRTLEYLNVELDPNGTHEERHRFIDEILENLIAVNDDSSAVRFEGPEGPGRSRAAGLLCNKVMSLLAVVQILGRFQRDHRELVSPAFREILETMRSHFREIAAVNNYRDAYQLTQSLRRTLLQLRASFENESALVTRLTQTSLDVVSDLAMVLRAYNALSYRDSTLLRTRHLATHHDFFVAGINGLRTAAVFFIGAVFWVNTGAPAAIMMMILPVVFSVMFARFAQVALAGLLKRLLVGVIIAIPLALLTLALLAQSTGHFPLLILVLAGPIFAGLLLLAERPTLPYGLGLCIPIVIIVQPSNAMNFQADAAVSTALGLLAGIVVLYWVFQLITAPDSRFMQKRLLAATARDLREIDDHDQPEHWFNGRMGERLLRIANHDQNSGSPDRTMTDMGLTGLNLGHVSLRLRSLIHPYRNREVEALLGQWQGALADTFMESARGRSSKQFREASDALYAGLLRAGEPSLQTRTVQGMFERLAFTFERMAEAVRQRRTSSGTPLGPEQGSEREPESETIRPSGPVASRRGPTP